MNGIILIDKPKGWTSFDVVAKVRGVLSQHAGKKIKVGHTGTLDPLATGLLVLTIGSYCKRAQEFTKLDKTYEVSMLLGQISTTGDDEGIKTKVSDEPVSEELLVKTLQLFVGQIMQTPPAYSAIKINGQRAYKLARSGNKVQLQPRPVTIHSINLTSYEYPLAKLMVSVSSGTYVRSLVEDIGNKLKTGAYMTDLRRVLVGQFSTDQAINPAEVDQNKLVQFKT
jgi:tRNA pseudouridine55 synthase